MAGNWIDRVSHRRGVWLSVQTRALLRLPRAALVHIASRARADPAREPRRPGTLPARSHHDSGRSTSRPGRPALTAGVATQRLGAASRREDRPLPRTNPAEAAPHTPTQWGAARGSLPYPHLRPQAPRVSPQTSDIRAARVRRPSNPRSTMWSRTPSLFPWE